jgi:hypothetical protein
MRLVGVLVLIVLFSIAVSAQSSCGNGICDGTDDCALDCTFTKWITPVDGILVMDRNSDGIIQDEDFFGDGWLTGRLPGALKENSFEDLASLDGITNGDGVISSADPGFADLRIWQDANTNGRVDLGELFTLAQKNIVEIGLAYRDENGPVIKQVGSYKTATEIKVMAGAVWLSREEVEVDNGDRLMPINSVLVLDLEGDDIIDVLACSTGKTPGTGCSGSVMTQRYEINSDFIQDMIESILIGANDLTYDVDCQGDVNVLDVISAFRIYSQYVPVCNIS